MISVCRCKKTKIIIVSSPLEYGGHDVRENEKLIVIEDVFSPRDDILWSILLVLSLGRRLRHPRKELEYILWKHYKLPDGYIKCNVQSVYKRPKKNLASTFFPDSHYVGSQGPDIRWQHVNTIKDHQNTCINNLSKRKLNPWGTMGQSGSGMRRQV